MELLSVLAIRFPVKLKSLKARLVEGFFVAFVTRMAYG
jgi:hypothetical protein